VPDLIEHSSMFKLGLFGGPLLCVLCCATRQILCYYGVGAFVLFYRLVSLF
jgi:hypothetical protein